MLMAFHLLSYYIHVHVVVMLLGRPLSVSLCAIGNISNRLEGEMYFAAQNGFTRQHPVNDEQDQQ